MKWETSNEHFPKFFHENENNKSNITVSQTSETTSFTGFELNTKKYLVTVCLPALFLIVDLLFSGDEW